MDIHPGEFVYTTKGRDRDKCFLVVACYDTYLYLSDGKHRKVSNPKKKNLKHIVATGIKDQGIVEILDLGNMPTNKEIRCSIRKYVDTASEQNC